MLWDEPKIFFLERRYFFSIILSEFLKNRVALHTDDGEYQVMDFGENFSVEGFSEGDDVVITYTGTLENEEKPPVITAMEAAQ